MLPKDIFLFLMYNCNCAILLFIIGPGKDIVPIGMPQIFSKYFDLWLSSLLWERCTRIQRISATLLEI